MLGIQICASENKKKIQFTSLVRNCQQDSGGLSMANDAFFFPIEFFPVKKKKKKKKKEFAF